MGRGYGDRGYGDTHQHAKTAVLGPSSGNLLVDVSHLPRLVGVAISFLVGGCPQIRPDGIVDTNDILLVISAWGPCP